MKRLAFLDLQLPLAGPQPREFAKRCRGPLFSVESYHDAWTRNSDTCRKQYAKRRRDSSPGSGSTLTLPFAAK
jgi:hypothetical protein